MAAINRVVLVGNLTRDPELRHTPSGTAVLQSASRGEHEAQGRDRPVGRQAELLRRHRLGQPGRALRAVPRQGAPGRRRRAARVARVGDPGGQQASGRRRGRRNGAVPRQPRWRAAAEPEAEAISRPTRRRRLPGTSPRLRPTTTSRSRRPEWLRRHRRASGRAPGTGADARSCHFCKDKVADVDYKNINQIRRYISEKGKIRNRRISGACRRHQRQVAVAVKRAREMALLPYVQGS